MILSKVNSLLQIAASKLQTLRYMQSVSSEEQFTTKLWAEHTLNSLMPTMREAMKHKRQMHSLAHSTRLKRFLTRWLLMLP